MKVSNLFIITEATHKKQPPPEQQSRTQTDDPFLRAFGGGKEIPSQDDVNPRQMPTAPEPPPEPRHRPRLRQAGAERTRQRTANIELPHGAEDKLRAIHDLNLDDQMSDADVLRHASASVPGEENRALPAPPTTGLAKIKAALTTIGTAIARLTDIQPDWHQVKHLPGYLQRPIRAMGRQVFGSFTETPIEDITVVANLGHSGNPNTDREINAVAKWVTENGKRDTEGEINFEKTIPGYSADFKMYRILGMTFLFVSDFAGKYIYSWPSSDEVSLKRSQERVIPQLPHR